MLNNNREDEYSKIEEGNGTESTKHTERKEFIKCSLIAAGVVIVLFSVVLSIYFAVTDKRVDNKVSAGTMRYSVIGFDPTTKKIFRRYIRADGIHAVNIRLLRFVYRN